MFRMRTAAGLAAMAMSIMLAGSRVHAAIPAPTVVIHAIYGQGRLAVSWNAIPGATAYQVWVEDTSPAVRVMSFLGAAQVGCGSGTGACSVFTDVYVQPGQFYTRVASWNPEGYAAWSPRYDAMAEASMPRFVDQNGKYVGTMVDQQQAIRPFAGKPTMFTVVGATLSINMPITLYYTSDGCLGTAYMDGVIPDRIEFTDSFAHGYLRTGTLAYRNVQSSKQIDGMTNLPGGCNDINEQRHTMPVTVNYNATAEFGSLVGPFRAVY